MLHYKFQTVGVRTKIVHLSLKAFVNNYFKNFAVKDFSSSLRLPGASHFHQIFFLTSCNCFAIKSVLHLIVTFVVIKSQKDKNVFTKEVLLGHKTVDLCRIILVVLVLGS